MIRKLLLASAFAWAGAPAIAATTAAPVPGPEGAGEVEDTRMSFLEHLSELRSRLRNGAIDERLVGHVQPNRPNVRQLARQCFQVARAISRSKTGVDRVTCLSELARGQEPEAAVGSSDENVRHG